MRVAVSDGISRPSCSQRWDLARLILRSVLSQISYITSAAEPYAVAVASGAAASSESAISSTDLCRNP
jgi:hypothetical protein